MKALAIISRLFWPLVILALAGGWFALVIAPILKDVTPDKIVNTALVLGGWAVLIFLTRRKP